MGQIMISQGKCWDGRTRGNKHGVNPYGKELYCNFDAVEFESNPIWLMINIAMENHHVQWENLP